MKRLYAGVLLLALFISSPLQSFAESINAEFIPFMGVSFIGEDTTSRYTYQYSVWEPAGLTYYQASNDTYEHETIFYNYDNTAYATDIFPGPSWGSTFPDSYLDTQAFDGGDEPNIAIGTFDPDDLPTYEWQTSFVRIDPTASQSSMYKISGQRGKSICELGPWCVLQSTRTTTLIPFKSQFTAPESTRYYIYEYDTNTDGNNYARNTKINWWNSGTMSTQSDVDYFFLDILTTQDVNFILKQSHFNNGEDYDIVILDLGGNVIAQSNNGQGVDEVFSKDDMQAGKYFVKIYSYSGFNQEKTYNFIAY